MSPFNCTPMAEETQVEAIERQNSAFGDNYSIKSRSTNSHHANIRYHDEPEADYDEGATLLYRHIENKDWDQALGRLEGAPVEAKTWVFRREANSEKTRWRLLPIHAVCIFRAPLALIEALIEVYPDGPQMKDDQGMLPVHLACRNGASKGVVMTLLAAFPESIHVRDRKGRSPVDLVLNSASANKEAVLVALKKFRREVPESPTNMNMEVLYHHNNTNTTNLSSTRSTPLTIEPAISKREKTPRNNSIGSSVGAAPTPHSLAVPPTPAAPGSPVVKEVDYEHRTILFRLILKKEWKAASARAASHPEEAQTWIVTKGFNGNLRFLPLHKACVLQPPDYLIEELLRAYNPASMEKDQDGWLPLHCACFYGANEKVISVLLAANPRGAQSKDDEGRLPLHYACLKGAAQGCVDALLQCFPKGAMSKDDEGRLPIHHACGKEHRKVSLTPCSRHLPRERSPRMTRDACRSIMPAAKMQVSASFEHSSRYIPGPPKSRTTKTSCRFTTHASIKRHRRLFRSSCKRIPNQ
ncbi:hypothetical protein MPSEU_000413400 [Mayamaea pseudoterrestris]|nr:hypothetical protein MPSEU_000413400 [Mayamaea pseudoterrestris]